MNARPRAASPDFLSRMTTHRRWLNAALIGIVALTVALAVEAARAARDHEAVATRVLRDYAALGAEGVANRLRATLAGRLFPLLAAVGPRPAASREILAASTGGAAAELTAAVSWVANVLEQGPPALARYDVTYPPPAELSMLTRRALAELPEGGYFALVPGPNHLLVIGLPRGDGTGTPVFAIASHVIADLIQQVVTRDPILPAALSRAAPLGDQVEVVVWAGVDTLAQRGRASDTSFGASEILGGGFGGITVEVRLAAGLAPALVIGGLPRSRLPYLVAGVLLTVTLAGTGLLLLRRESRLSLLREDFVAGASHELRTPLAQIRLSAETLRLGRIRHEGERERAVEVVEREARRMEHLVSNLLHFSRTERGAFSVAPQATQLAALTSEIVRDFRPLAEKAGVTLRSCGEVEAEASVDPAAWRQIVNNLLDNAVKYSGPGTTVEVQVSETDSQLLLAVSDHGPGVADADRDLIWERFWRAEGAGPAGIAGTGLGLAIVRDLVLLHGGRCHVERASPDGARFVIALPRIG